MKNLTTIILVFICHLSFSQSPGNVSSNLQWWFKANSGTSTTTDAAQINTWNNSGSFATTSVSRSSLSTAGYPMYKTSIINFNPVVLFSSSSSSAFQTTFSGVHATDVVNMNPTADNTTTVIVFKSSQSSGGTNQYSSPNFISTERTTTIYDYEVGFTGGKVAVKVHHSNDNWSAQNSSTYNDNIARIASITRLKDGSAANPSTLNIYMNAKSDINTTSAGTSYSLNSPDYTTASTFCGFNIGAQVNSGNTAFNGGTPYSGDIAEIIVYDAVLSSTNLQKVQSYLAVKYGITLDQTSAYDYLRSDGTVIWDGTSSSGYNKDIAGIGQDDNSGLSQPMSQSINANSMVLMKTASDITNNEFMMWGDNGTSVTSNSNNLVDVPSGIESRLKRVWKITETGDVGTVTVTIDVSNIPGSKTLADLRLIVDDDGTFASGTSTLYSAASLTSNIATFNLVDFNNTNQRFFTLGSVLRSRTALPVDFVNVKWENTEKGKTLLWDVVNENNIQKYTVSISTDIFNWTQIASLDAQKTSNSILNYEQLIPENISHYIYYVKVDAVEFDNKITNSKTISVADIKAENVFINSPDPCDDHLDITSNSDFELVEIADITGKQLHNFSFTPLNNGYRLITDHLPTGMYLLILKNEFGNIHIEKFEVIH